MEKREFKITRVFNAPRELVFQAWTDPKYVKQWWGPAGFTCPYCEIDFRVGGRFHFCMQAPSGEKYWNVGTYREIVVPEKIVSSIRFSDEEGNARPASYYFGETDCPDEMIDVVTFESLDDGKTRLTLCRNHSEELANKLGEIQGWNGSLDRFAEVVERQATRL